METPRMRNGRKVSLTVSLKETLRDRRMALTCGNADALSTLLMLTLLGRQKVEPRGETFLLVGGCRAAQ
jgi:hypothetical protein